MKECKKTPLYEFHSKHGHIVEFSGFCMPLYFKSIIQEHLSVRNNVGLFDVSHMGRIFVKGKRAADFLNYITANDISKLEDGKAQYTLFLNERGGIIDDLIIYQLTKEAFLLVVNAGNREKDYKWLEHHSKLFDTSIVLENKSDQSVMFAIQGPNAKTIIKDVFPQTVDVKRFRFITTTFNGDDLLISRTGYTGEDGFELILFYSKLENAKEIWNVLLNHVNGNGGLPCGLGARDSLRIEAGYCLYGNDINEDTNPYEAGLSWVVKLYKDNFIGKEALEKINEEGNINRIRIGVVMDSKIVPRPGYKIFNADKREIGVVTSGSFSPILNRGIGMAYIQKEYANEGNVVTMYIRNKEYKAIIKNFPLYDPDKFGYKRKVI